MATSTNGHQEQPIACDPTAIPSEEREAHFERAKQVWSEVALERQELPDGYALRFDADQYSLLAAFIANERLCCPFLRFTLEVTPGQGSLWLRITGGEDVKEALQAELTRAEGQPGAYWKEAAAAFGV